MTAPTPRKPKRPCSVENCAADSRTRGMCHPHYQKAMRALDAPPVRMRPAEVLLELDWLIGGGVHPLLAAQEMGLSAPALLKLARKHGRNDLAAKFTAAQDATEDERFDA